MTAKEFQVLFIGIGLLYPDVHLSPQWPTAQAVHETGNFTSHNYEANNNCFGMGVPVARDTTCTNKGQAGYAHYDNVLDGIRDYYLWARATGNTTDAALINKIKGNYATDPLYYKRVAAQVAALTKAGAYVSKSAVLAAGGLSLAGITLAGAFAVSEMV